MYDKKPVKGQVTGTSLGYGFVQFQDHDHALGTLRHLNNNPTIFGPHKVHFLQQITKVLKSLPACFCCVATELCRHKSVVCIWFGTLYSKHKH